MVTAKRGGCHKGIASDDDGDASGGKRLGQGVPKGWPP